MKNIFLYTLLDFEVPKSYIEKMDIANIHLYDIFNSRVSSKDLTYIILNNRNSIKVTDILEKLRETSNIELMKSKIGSVSLLYGFGATERNLNYLRNNSVYTIFELRDYLSDENSIVTTSYGKAHLTLFKKMLSTYDEWFLGNRDLINKEFDIKNSKLNSSEMNNEIQKNSILKKKLKYFKIASFPNTLSEFMKLDFKNKDILEKTMQGYNLREIGSSQGITRERVRQIKLKICENLPEFDDVAKYRRLFINYNFTAKDFELLTGQSESLYNFIELKYGKNGKESINKYVLLSPRMSMDEKREFFGKKDILIGHDGELIKISRMNIMRDVLIENHEVLNIPKYKKLISEYVERNRLSKKYIPDSERSIYNIIGRLPAIRRTGGLFRYYDLSVIEDYEKDIQELFEVDDGIYGIDYFYDLNPDLMKTIDIRDSDELANLVKQISYDKFPRIKKIERQSQVWIGNIEPDSFYKKILMKFDNESLDSFFDYIDSNFKLNMGSVRSLIVTNYKKYIHNNSISFYVKLPDNQKFYDECKNKLNMSIYSYDMFTHKINDIDETVDVTPQLLSKLGYYERGEIIFNKKFGKQQSAIDDYLLNREYISSDDIQEFHSRSINYEVYSLELSHDLLKISEDKYMTISKFEKANFSKNDINDFLNEVKNFVQKDKFFSWKSLIRNGFDAPLISATGFDSMFFERLIFTMKDVRTINTTTPIFIIYGEEKSASSPTPPLADFLEQIFADDKEDIVDFINDFKSEYGLDLDKDKVISKIKDSNLVYSPEMKKVYKNEKCMLDDIYD